MYSPIHEVAYTCVFSLDKASFLAHPKFIEKVLNSLINIVFEDGEGDSIFGENEVLYDEFLSFMSSQTSISGNFEKKDESLHYRFFQQRNPTYQLFKPAEHP